MGGFDKLDATIEKILRRAMFGPQRDTYSESPPRVRAARKRREQRLAANGGRGITRKEWADLLEYYGHRCAYCLEEAEDLQVDHIQSVARGGAHDLDNVVPACARCNSSKKEKSLLEIVAGDRLLVTAAMFSLK